MALRLGNIPHVEVFRSKQEAVFHSRMVMKHLEAYLGLSLQSLARSAKHLPPTGEGHHHPRRGLRDLDPIHAKRHAAVSRCEPQALASYVSKLDRNLGITEKKTGIMEKKMETTIGDWGSIRIIHNLRPT